MCQRERERERDVHSTSANLQDVDRGNVKIVRLLVDSRANMLARTWKNMQMMHS